MDLQELRRLVRDIPDFPKPGIVFKDITPVLRSHAAFAFAVEKMCEPYLAAPPDMIAPVDARGFLFGAAMAQRLGAGIAPIRKKGKLPYRTVEVAYALEYGEAVLEAHVDAISPGQRVVVVDDLLATGGTASAAAQIVGKLGGQVCGVSFMVELAFLHGRAALKDFAVNALFAFD